MPTYETTERFRRDFDYLSPEERGLFREAVENFVHDLEADHSFRAGLRIKGVKGAPGVFEMTWADDGRATFEYGQEIIEGKPHIIWRRIGGHGIFRSP